jgi:ABC-type Fe3+/spermidine/putrescine transport system ATPase subunit
MTTHLSVEGIRKSFGEKTVLDGVSLSVGTGELMALLGPSGCGKSTLLRVVAGLLPKDAGEVRIGGRDMDSTPARERGVGFVFQDYALFPRITVLENVAFGPRIRGVEEAGRNRQAREMLDLVGLSEEANRPVDQLSGGERQRVALARALAVEPKLLLLDEPLSALDVKVRERLRREIKAIQKKVGITAVIVTHDQEEAMELGDRIAVMNDGRIEQIASPREVYQEPATEFVARFVGDVNVLPGQMYHGYAYSGSLAIRMTGGSPPREESWVKVILRPEDISVLPPGIAEAGQSQAKVESVSFQGTHLRATLLTEEGYSLTALLLRSHPMARKLAEGDAVRVEALRGSVLPDPFGKREPEYYL